MEHKSNELNVLQDSSICEKRKHQERLSILLIELNAMGLVLGAKPEEGVKRIDSSIELSDAEFTKARIHLSNLRFVCVGGCVCDLL